MTRHILVLLACAMSLVPSSALAESATTLAQVRALVEGQEYEDAQEALGRILETGELGPPQLVEVYRFMAECSAALRQPDAATDAFVKLLAVNPDIYVSSSESPLLREPFEQAQAYWTEHARPTPHFEPPRAVSPDQPFEVAVDLGSTELPELFSDIRIHYRTESGGFFTTIEATDGRATIPQDQLEDATTLELHISVHDEHGNTVAWIGSPEEPLRISVGEVPADVGRTNGHRRRIYQQWWFWTIIGVAVVGLAVGIPVGLTQSGGDVCEDTLGNPCDLVVTLGR